VFTLLKVLGEDLTPSRAPVSIPKCFKTLYMFRSCF
jgi:hypothetical protein